MKKVFLFVGVVALLFIFCGTGSSDENTAFPASMGKHYGVRSTVIFCGKSDGTITGVKFFPYSGGAFPRSGYFTCRNLAVFPIDTIQDKIKSALASGEMYQAAFVLDYEIVNHVDIGIDTYEANVTKAEPFEPLD